MSNPTPPRSHPHEAYFNELFGRLPEPARRNMARIMQENADRRERGEAPKHPDAPLVRMEFDGDETSWEMVEKVAEMYRVSVEELMSEGDEDAE